MLSWESKLAWGENCSKSTQHKTIQYNALYNKLSWEFKPGVKTVLKAYCIVHFIVLFCVKLCCAVSYCIILYCIAYSARQSKSPQFLKIERYAQRLTQGYMGDGGSG